jgi:hypothetical protein
MGKATLILVTRHQWLYPLVYLGAGVIYIIRWVVVRTGLAGRWTRHRWPEPPEDTFTRYWPTLQHHRRR